ncbi:MAG: phosphopantothenoylcysteine decarboxylase [Candidatus Omnitrophota bacterium]|nr:phosphopantothenoylcysteine decarboxylase [Candidatus Omnitrophota bacterium]
MPRKPEQKKIIKKNILITAGPTIEPIDPVRYLTNRSSGTMGYKIAEKMIAAGHEVCIISGPVSVSPPSGAEIISVETADEMNKEVIGRIDACDCIIMAAAVCDFRPARKENRKIKELGKYTLEMVRNPDILKGVRDRNIIKIGFALETDDPIKNGKKKLAEKELDAIIVNSKTDKNDPFGKAEVKREYILIKPGDDVRTIKDVTKDEMAEMIKKEVEKMLWV